MRRIPSTPLQPLTTQQVSNRLHKYDGPDLQSQGDLDCEAGGVSLDVEEWPFANSCDGLRSSLDIYGCGE